MNSKEYKSMFEFDITLPEQVNSNLNEVLDLTLDYKKSNNIFSVVATGKHKHIVTVHNVGQEQIGISYIDNEEYMGLTKEQIMDLKSSKSNDRKIHNYYTNIKYYREKGVLSLESFHQGYNHSVFQSSCPVVDLLQIPLLVMSETKSKLPESLVLRQKMGTLSWSLYCLINQVQGGFIDWHKQNPPNYL